jgi:hypothetical protein
MTTSSTSTRIRHDSDANFREWMNELHTMITTVGAVQTADTGQINLATATRAGINSDAGYTCYYVNDSLHGTAPIYFKLYWGTHNGTSRARLRIEVGTGTNGSGTLTGGDATIRTISGSSNTDLTTDTTYLSHACMARGGFWFVAKIGRVSANYAFMGVGIFRNCDADGDLDSTGHLVLYHNNSTSNSTAVPNQRYYRPTAAWSAFSTNIPFTWPAPDTASVADEDGNVQFMIPFYGMLRPRPFNNFLVCWNADVTLGTTYTLTGVGVTAYTYISLVQAFGNISVNFQSSQNLHGMLLVYE